ncbi:MAG TPA: hypothetical protein VF984_14870 [Actinomycetota bacterium]
MNWWNEAWLVGGPKELTWATSGYVGRGPEQAMANLADTGAGWVAIIPKWWQDDVASTQIHPLDPPVPTDEEIVQAIRHAHDLGLRVMLKPHLGFVHDPEHWHGEIGTAWNDDPAAWDRWFASFRRFIIHFADIAEAEEVEQSSVGCELQGATRKAERWREIVRDVRDHFSGTLVYSANWGGEETGLPWWDAVDLIGVDAYYPLTEGNDPTLGELKAAWTPYVEQLAELSAAWGDKPIVFTEIGYRSVDGANRLPADMELRGLPDLQEQADCYRAALESVWGQPWFAGMYWWDWSSSLVVGGPADTSFTAYRKPAEGVIRSWYRSNPGPSGNTELAG